MYYDMKYVRLLEAQWSRSENNNLSSVFCNSAIVIFVQLLNSNTYSPNDTSYALIGTVSIATMEQIPTL